MTPVTKPLSPDTGSNTLRKSQAEQNRFSNKTVSTVVAKKSIGNTIKSIPHKISIFLRAVVKFFVITYYVIKHYALKKPIDTSEKLNAIFKSLGPAFAKIAQPTVSTLTPKSSFITEFCLKFPKDKKHFTADELKKMAIMYKAAKDLLDKATLNDMTREQAQEVLNKRFNKKYTVGKCLGEGSIASVYEVTSTDGTQRLAKVISAKTEDQLAVGIKSMELSNLFTRLIDKKLYSVVQSTLSAFNDECNLNSEHQKLCGYKAALTATESSTEFSYDKEQICNIQEHSNGSRSYTINSIPVEHLDLSFSVPDVAEPLDPKHDNLLIMKKVDGHTLASLMKDKALFSQEFEKCLGRKPDTGDPAQKYECDELASLMKGILKRISEKWNQVMVTQGWVHGDLHSGNIMITFKPKGKLVVSLIDLGNSIKIKDSEREFIQKFYKSIKNYAATAKSSTDIITKEEHAFLKPSYIISEKNKEKILDNLHADDVKQIKALFDLIMSQASDKTISNQNQERLYRVIFHTLSYCNMFWRNPGTRDMYECNTNTSFESILTEFISCGIQLSPNIFRILSAKSRGSLEFDHETLATGKLPVKTHPTPAPMPMQLGSKLMQPGPQPMPQAPPFKPFGSGTLPNDHGFDFGLPKDKQQLTADRLEMLKDILARQKLSLSQLPPDVYDPKTGISLDQLNTFLLSERGISLINCAIDLVAPKTAKPHEDQPRYNVPYYPATLPGVQTPPWMRTTIPMTTPVY